MSRTITPISYGGAETLSLRQLDELNGVPKGTSFRAFKAHQAQLVEGVDYFYLDAGQQGALIDQLKLEGRVYLGSRHVLLMTRSGYQSLSGARARKGDVHSQT
ncbi:hypothetical protein [Pseudomonas sp.]|uniref:hypothetical protein n=1 Tax=Pseudomonas sp. TaxID=306 RepID=UPI00272D931A|nr:hypothetical protein [Pseudomonas sp.]